MGTSYRVAFGHDPMTQKGGGLLSHFVPVPGTIYLSDDANMEVMNTCAADLFVAESKPDTDGTYKV